MELVERFERELESEMDQGPYVYSHRRVIAALRRAARPTADLGEDGELAAAIYEALKADGGDAYMDDGEYLDGVTLDGSFDLLVAAKKLRAVLSRSEK